MYNKENTVKVSRQFRSRRNNSPCSVYHNGILYVELHVSSSISALEGKHVFRFPGRGLHTHLSARETNHVSIATGSGQDRTVSRNKRLSVRPNPPTKDNGEMSSEEVDFLGEKKLEKKRPSRPPSRHMGEPRRKVSGRSPNTPRTSLCPKDWDCFPLYSSPSASLA